MDFLQMCLVLTLSLTLMTHAVFSAPFNNDAMETADFQQDFESYLALIRQPRDTETIDGSDDVLGRVRRQVAQMASNRRGYRGRRMHRYRGRLYARRMHARRASKARGRVVTW